MNFDDAITAHSQWKIRLQGVINGSSKEILDPQVVGLDNKCPLGQWIHGEAKQQYSQLPEYSVLVKQHAEFHQSAASVLRLALAGQMDQAKACLETGGSFMEASIRTITAIRQLRRKVEPA
jgi:methyl-accepting chemotaxis protein